MGAVPVAVTVKVTGSPTVTDCTDGGVVMVGATGAEVTVRAKATAVLPDPLEAVTV
jgi:hypothetical protein